MRPTRWLANDQAFDSATEELSRFQLTAPICLAVAFFCGLPSILVAQTTTSGFERLSGRYIDVITDMPLSDELRDLPAAFDAAVPLWCEAFGVQLDAVANWHVEAYVMLERERFRAAGLIPVGVENFVYGFQLGDQLWVTEQPSAYYRRHLLLHEGTHWFMNRRFGGNAPPWLMEGMAEWFGTHAWNGQQLFMNVIPRANTDVPYWGRISIIQDQLSKGTAPSLENILRYGNTAHQQVDAYAWSWAAVVFLKHHPDSAAAFAAMMDQPMRDDATLTRWLFNDLREQWPRLRGDWRAFVTELEYGYDISRGMLRIGNAPVLSNQAIEVDVRTDVTWQSVGIRVNGPVTLQVKASGSYSVGRIPGPWVCEPQGVTLDYYRGEPLGKLMLAVVAEMNKEPTTTMKVTAIPIGLGGSIEVEESGELFFRVNEASSGLADNSGTLTVVVRP